MEPWVLQTISVVVHNYHVYFHLKNIYFRVDNGIIAYDWNYLDENILTLLIFETLSDGHCCNHSFDIASIT